MKITRKRFLNLLNVWKRQNPGSLSLFVAQNLGEWVGHNILEDRTLKLLANKERRGLYTKRIDALISRNGLVLADTKPTTKDNYVGIEIECFSSRPQTEIQVSAIERGIDKWVQIGTDGSIRPNFGHKYELRILIKEKDLSKSLVALDKFLKAGKFGVNKTCGLHVHLDMRNRNMNECYASLRKFQDLLFAMVSTDRQYNDRYCAYVDDTNQETRKVAINKRAYEKHRTLEIRLHQGTLDMKKIENWVGLLLKIVHTKQYPKDLKLHRKDSVIKWLNHDESLKEYVDTTFDTRWGRNNGDGLDEEGEIV